MPTTTERRRRTRRRRRGRRRAGLPSRPLLILALVAVGILLCWAGFRWKERSNVPESPDWITQEFIPVNPYSRPGDPLPKINGVVVHYVGNPGTTAAQNRSYFAGLALSGETYASSHFLVGLDGEILQNIPLDEIAYCSNQRNDDTISIECCHPTDDGHFTPETYDSLVRLVVWLMDSYDLDTNQVIRHHDVNGKECPRWYVQHPEDWAAFLQDLEAARAQ